ncbi:hypothetical protein SAMN04488065_0535 [Haloplanus vescus]|uniref:Membrane domain of glycerophosphoryl diester phosphodiesterase n=1 Tax=Haloplanus vescus TaxID=555874 RepID=A0A1H3W3F1_9EURY|nr:hypothetical protein [Haloplanus vescus]SDZ81665.1 hypothetical protein SAMN04488065_0535 [Haloplanus vescus]
MPSWYAFAALSTARDATEDFLRPIDRGRWLRLALIALFVGIGGGLPTGSGNFNLPSGGGGGGGGGGAPPNVAPSLPESSVLAIVVALVVLAVGLILLWNLVGAVMEFVLVAGLRDRDLSIRASFREHFRPGLRLFGFRILVGLVSLLLIAIPLIAVFGLGFSISAALFALVLPLMALFAIVGLVSSVALGLTTDFVVPTMLTENRGVLDGWRRIWPTLRAEWKQVGLYVVAKFVLGIAVSLAVSIAVLVAAIVLAIPFAIVGGILFFAASAAGVHAAGWVIVAVFIALFVAALFVISLLAQAPALAFVRYYSLSVLGLLDSDLDLVGVDDDGEDGDDDGGDGENGDDDSGGEDGDSENDASDESQSIDGTATDDESQETPS